MHIYTHIHHIVPKHMGGTNDPSNLIELTVEDHAIAHFVLWKIYKKWQDLCAYRVLIKEIDQKEVIKIVKQEAGRMGGKANKGKSKSFASKTTPFSQKKICKFCNKQIDLGNYAKYHGNKCKTITNIFLLNCLNSSNTIRQGLLKAGLPINGKQYKKAKILLMKE